MTSNLEVNKWQAFEIQKRWIQCSWRWNSSSSSRDRETERVKSKVYIPRSFNLASFIMIVLRTLAECLNEWISNAWEGSKTKEPLTSERPDNLTFCLHCRRCRLRCEWVKRIATEMRLEKEVGGRDTVVVVGLLLLLLVWQLLYSQRSLSTLFHACCSLYFIPFFM